jgi:hypothetical protein
MHASDQKAMESLDRETLAFALHGGYLHQPSGKFVWYTDGMQYMNHAPSPYANVGLGTWPPLEQDHTVALRDIAAGEELFEDYSFWANGGLSPGHWLFKLYLRHCPHHYAFLAGLEQKVAA